MRCYNPDISPSLPELTPEPAPASALPQVSLLMPILSPLRLTAQALAVELPAGRALTVHVRRAGVLRLSGARVWLTFTGPGANHKQQPASEPGDLFLLDGHAWAPKPGQSLVLEPFAETAPGRCSTQDTSRLSWQPAPDWATQRLSAWRGWLASESALKRPSGCPQGWQTAGS